MSIISEALKKAQQKRAEDVVGPRDAVQSAINELSQEPKSIIIPKKISSAKNIIIAGSVVVVIFLLMFVVFASFVAKVQKNAMVQIDAPAPAAQIVPTVRQTSAPTTYGMVSKLSGISGLVDSFSARAPKRLPTLNGIMYAASNPKAIIGGKSVSEGDIVNGYTIKHILPYKVTVTSDDKTYDLKLN